VRQKARVRQAERSAVCACVRKGAPARQVQRGAAQEITAREVEAGSGVRQVERSGVW